MRISNIFHRDTVSVRANAKINIALAVTGKRDDGYHTIDTVMQSVSLADSLKLSKCEGIRIRCSNKNMKAEENIAYKAAAYFFEETKISAGVEIKIKKRIPTAAGLGGGSADAAAVLLGLNRLYKTDLSQQKLEEIALRLGADVPFFIEGGTKRAEGIGEELTKLSAIEKGYFLLTKAEKKPSTAEMYKRLDGGNPPIPDINKVIYAIEVGDQIELGSSMDNSFAAVWKQSIVKQRLLSLNPQSVSLSGSGPVWFAYFTDKKEALAAYKTLKKEKTECYLTKPCDKAIVFE